MKKTVTVEIEGRRIFTRSLASTKGRRERKVRGQLECRLLLKKVRSKRRTQGKNMSTEDKKDFGLKEVGKVSARITQTCVVRKKKKRGRPPHRDVSVKKRGQP